MKHLIIVAIFVVISGLSCKLGSAGESVQPTSEPALNEPRASDITPKLDPAFGGGQTTPAKTANCDSVDTGEYEVVKAQTFPIDFEPFRGSCFVTSHDPAYPDPPLQSEYGIYKNGKRVYEFENQFNGVNFGCWVDAVSFQDLNGDGRTDIIVVSKCSGKSAVYNENMVYANTGDGFATDLQANTRLAKFSRVKDVAAYVKDNLSTFFN